MSGDVHYLELLEVGQLIQSGKLCAKEVTESMLARIRTLDPQLGSYCLVMEESALAEAAKADQEISAGLQLGLLHGVPIAVKDLCWTEGVTTAAGMPLYQDFQPQEDATVVKKLRAAGAVILGKLQMTESAYVDHHPDIEPPKNPWNAAHWAGVSSSGSGVATAAGLCFGSLGTDTGGSIRFPSAANNLTGLKPTWGRVSRYGVFELAATLDHIGPMTRSAKDAGAMLGVIAGADRQDPTAVQLPVPDFLAHLTADLSGIRIGLDTSWATQRIDQPTEAVLQGALAELAALGAEVVEVSFPDVTDALVDWFPLCAVEAAVAHESTFDAHLAMYGPAFRAIVENGRKLSGTDYQKIILRRHAFTGKVNAIFQGIDLLIVPVTGVSAPTLAQIARMGVDEELMSAMLRYTCPFDLSGHPTITLPGGFDTQGMPIGFQLVAERFAEELLVRVGAAFQQATDWHQQHPLA